MNRRRYDGKAEWPSRTFRYGSSWLIIVPLYFFSPPMKSARGSYCGCSSNADLSQPPMTAASPSNFLGLNYFKVAAIGIASRT